MTAAFLPMIVFGLAMNAGPVPVPVAVGPDNRTMTGRANTTQAMTGKANTTQTMGGRLPN